MIQVINRALDIIEIVAKDSSRTFPLNEIATTLNLNNGTCANIIKTLVNRGYLEQEGRKTGYRLGPMAYFLTGNFSHKQEVVSAAAEPMNKLFSRTNESCMICSLKDNMRVVLWELKSTHELQVVNKKEKEAYLTSTGRMILSCMTDAEQNLFFNKYGLPSTEIWVGIEDKEDLVTELRKIRKKQLAIQISKAQVIGFAVPIYKDKKIVASLGMYLPQSRCTPTFQNFIIEEIKKTGEIINNNLASNKI